MAKFISKFIIAKLNYYCYYWQDLLEKMNIIARLIIIGKANYYWQDLWTKFIIGKFNYYWKD